MIITERTLQSIEKELEKLTVRKERYEKILEKKLAKAEKFNMAITDEEFFKIRDNVTPEQYAVYFEVSIARTDLNDVLKKIEKTKQRYEKNHAEVVKIRAWQTLEEAERQRAEEIEKWAQDGIIVKDMSSNFVCGITPNGKRFSINSNNGFTNRSLHCYTLTIEGETIFTSGEFYRAYITVKNR